MGNCTSIANVSVERSTSGQVRNGRGPIYTVRKETDWDDVDGKLNRGQDVILKNKHEESKSLAIRRKASNNDSQGKPEVTDQKSVGSSRHITERANKGSNEKLTPSSRSEQTTTHNNVSGDATDAVTAVTDEPEPDPVPQVQLFDPDENEEFVRQLQEAYRRKPPILSRKELLADVYKMDFPHRGTAIVINNENFKNNRPRKGTQIDFSRICSRLERLSFDVERYNDLTCRQMMDVFNNAAEKDHSEKDCFACVLLSHGGSNEIHGTDGEIRLEDIFSLFGSSRCPTLAGKPKLFFIQSCRGEVFDDGTDINYAKLNVTDAEGGFDIPEEDVEICIPEEADFLISYSTVDGYYSWRHSQKGSWYIQSLVRVLDECGTLVEIKKILTKVNKMVAFEFESSAKNHMRKKQIPSFNSKLTKDLYFSPK